MARFVKGKPGKGETDGIPEPDADDRPRGKRQMVSRNLRNRRVEPPPDNADGPKLTKKGRAPKGKIPPWVKKA